VSHVERDLTDEEADKLASEIAWLLIAWAGKDPERIAQALAFAETSPCLGRPRTSAVLITRITSKGSKSPRFTVNFSRLPGKPFGPYSTAGAIAQLEAAALLTRADARDLILNAEGNGCATRGYS
jgi:hypothetical protein